MRVTGLNVKQLPQQLVDGLSILSEYFNFRISDKGIKLVANKGDELSVFFNGRKAVITYPNDPAFYRAVGHILQQGKAFETHEKPRFDMCGAMYDHSRNGVLNMEYTKRFISTMAMLGIDTYLMYMEDVYQLEGEPLFGYLRGAYTEEQLKEIDAFASKLGIEVIPCIQTLAHLNTFLRYDTIKNKYGDLGDILEVGKPEVVDLIDRMFDTMKRCFKTKRLHAGMDEAYHVGRGKYLDHNGYQTRKQVMTRQIEIVSLLAQKHGFELLIWDDMFYRGEGSELTGNRPANTHLVYWNYYDEKVDSYLEKLDIRLADDPNTFFAGGAWRWGGAVPCHRRTIVSTETALSACCSKGVRNVFTTLWGDDGCETPVETGLLGMTMFAEYNYSPEYSRIDFKKKLLWVSGMDYASWMLQDDINNFADQCDHDNCFDKYALYQDPLCGVMDAYMKYASSLGDLTGHYRRLSLQFEELAKKNDKNEHLNLYYSTLCSVLELKWDLGLRITKAYKDKNNAELLKIVNHSIAPLIERVELLRERRLDLWLDECKLEGFEIIDARLGGVIARLKSTRLIIYRFVTGDIEAIEPLESERQAVTGKVGIVRFCDYSRISSPGESW